MNQKLFLVSIVLSLAITPGNYSIYLKPLHMQTLFHKRYSQKKTHVIGHS